MLGFRMLLQRYLWNEDESGPPKVVNGTVCHLENHDTEVRCQVPTKFKEAATNGDRNVSPPLA